MKIDASQGAQSEWALGALTGRQKLSHGEHASRTQKSMCVTLEQMPRQAPRGRVASHRQNPLSDSIDTVQL
jgi:hypothetical protein